MAEKKQSVWVGLAILFFFTLLGIIIAWRGSEDNREHTKAYADRLCTQAQKDDSFVDKCEEYLERNDLRFICDYPQRTRQDIPAEDREFAICKVYE